MRLKLRPGEWSLAVAVALGAISAPAARAQSADEGEARRAELQRRAAALKPRPEQLRWQQIPWVIDPAEAIRLAREEKRPLFFWAAGGRRRDGLPLERC